MRPLFLFLFAFSGFPCFSQDLSDSLFVAGALQITNNAYPSLETPVYNGRRYNSHGKFSDNGHVYFLNNKYVQGSIVYDGYTYRNVNIMYDLVRDHLVLLHFNNKVAITVIPQYVDSFCLLDHTFIHIRADSNNLSDADLKPGYYDLLYNGKIDLLAKRAKTITEKVTQTVVETSVAQEDRYYLFRDSVYTEIKSKKALLKLLRSTQSQNMQFIKASHLNFKRDKENALIALVKFHDSIAQK